MMQALLEAKAPYFVEVLGRHGEVKQRHRFEQLPISIGRSYANDVILDDAEVANFHAIVEATQVGALHVRESGSRSGIIYQGKRVASLTVDGDTVIKLGHAQVRVRSAAFIAKNKALNQSSPEWDGLKPALVGFLLLMLSSLVSIWLSDTGQLTMTNQLFSIAALFALVTLWSGIWAFAGRVIGGAARFGRHFFIVACGLVLVDIWSGVSTVFAYAFSLEFLTAYGNHVVVAMIAGMIFYHLNCISEQHPKRLMAICATLMVLGSGLLLLSNDQRDGHLADELYMKHLLPPATRLSANQPVEQFMQNAQALKAVVDQARLEAVDKSEDLEDSSQ
jgi:hypothetical protein